jgi:hypothetical protein
MPRSFDELSDEAKEGLASLAYNLYHSNIIWSSGVDVMVDQTENPYPITPLESRALAEVVWLT